MRIRAVLINRCGLIKLPSAATSDAAGADLQADIEEPYVLQPGERHLFPAGFKMELPPYAVADVRPRSGLALKHGVTVLNSPGTIDADYRGEMGVLLINHGSEPFTIHPGDRIAQMLVGMVNQPVFQLVDKLSETARGEGGYGSTGTKA